VIQSGRICLPQEEVPLCTDPVIWGTVIYYCGFKVLGSWEEWEVEITQLYGVKIVDAVFDEGNPLILTPTNRPRLVEGATKHFWSSLVETARSKVEDQVRGVS
jgi:hypothetical protein